MAHMEGKVLVDKWCIEDVQSRGGWLTDKQAVKVLEVMADRHDANIGINWEVIDIYIDQMYPEPDGWVDPDE